MEYENIVVNGYSYLFLSVFLLLLLFIMTFLYANAITTLVYPENIPVVYGSYGVEPGVNGNPSSNISKRVSGINEATEICDSDPECTLFYFDGRLMTYLQNDGIRYQNQPGGIYRRQIKINNIE